MAKLLSNLLDDLTIKNAKAQDRGYTLRDGEGLFLLVNPNGSKYFQLRTTLHGKRKLIQIGVYPSVGLGEARRLARIKSKQVKQDHVDPVLVARLTKQGKASDADNTFQKIADSWLEAKARTLAPSTIRSISQSLNKNVYPIIGKLPIKEIDNIMVRNCLALMQKRGALAGMASTRAKIRAVFEFALSDKLIEGNPLPVKDMRLEAHKGANYSKLNSMQDAGKLLRNLASYGGSVEVATCVYLQLHLAQRPSELRVAKWEEFDLEKGVWTLPIARSKTKKFMAKSHTTMLSKQALIALKELKQYTGQSDYLFPSSRRTRPISDETVRRAFKALFPDYRTVPHGCRHFFSTQANESGLFRSDVIEAFLSHGDEDKIRATYNGATYDTERRKLAQWWSDQLDTARDGAKVVSIVNTKTA